MQATDRIEKRVMLRAPRARVWRAIGDSVEFGKWFRCVFAGPFEPGKPLRATLQEQGWEGTTFLVFVERVEPERHLSFRWHPGAPDTDHSAEPTTLVSFDLEDAPDGTQLRIAESGFDALPDGRRTAARDQNAEGWAVQAERISEYVAKPA